MVPSIAGRQGILCRRVMHGQQTSQSQIDLNSLWEGHCYDHMESEGTVLRVASLDSPAWDQFLSLELDGELLQFVTTTLFDLELPMVAEAFGLVSRGNWNEFVNLDERLGVEMKSEAFREASRRTGVHRLGVLAPLEDHKMLQRYRRAVGSGDAVGWHPLVYAIFIDAYSIPLREGLSHYGSKAIESLVERVRSKSNVPVPKLDAFDGRLRRRLLPAIEAAVDRNFDGGLKVV